LWRFWAQATNHRAQDHQWPLNAFFAASMIAFWFGIGLGPFIAGGQIQPPFSRTPTSFAARADVRRVGGRRAKRSTFQRLLKHV
jgi:hypothetical protein